MTSRILAIDIQQEQISSALLSKGFRGVSVVETECIEIVQDKSGTDDINETADDNFFKSVLNALKKISAEIGNAYDRCLISIPSHYFFFRTLELPFRNRRKNSQILSFELDSHLPWPVEELESAFCMLDRNSKDAFGKNFAGVTGIQKVYMNKFMDIFDKCNIYPDLVTIGSGYSNALAYAVASEQSVRSFFVHVEPLSASIYVVKSGEIAFVRTFFVNSADPVQSVKTSLIHTILSFNDFFHSGHEADLAALKRPLKIKNFDKYGAKRREANSYFKGTLQDFHIKPIVKKSIKLDKIVVSGTALFRGKLCEEIEKQINIQVSDFNIIDTAKIISVQKYSSVQNAIAMGVNEMRGVDAYNFSRDASCFALFYQENRLNLIAAAVLCCIFFFTWSINPIMQIHHMEKTAVELDSRIIRVFKSCFPYVKTIVDPVNQMKINVNALQEKKEINFFDDHPLCIDLLNDTSRALPSSTDVSLSRFVRTEKHLLIVGSADQFNTIDKMKNNLKNISAFKKVDIDSASMDKVAKRVKFNLKISL